MDRRRGFLILLICLLPVLVLLFRASLHPDKVIFSNDGPLGVSSSDAIALPEIFTGAWLDLNWLGYNVGAPAPNVSSGLIILLGPLYYAKFLAPFSIFFLGVCAWIFFTRLGFSTGPAVIGAIAMALNSNMFSNVCWGLGSRAHAAGLFLLALAVLIPGKTRLFWVRLVLCGFCIGLAVMEAGDIGAIYSLYLAPYVVFHAWVEADSSASGRILKGLLRLAVVGLCAAFISIQALISLYGFGIKSVAGGSDSGATRSPSEQWDWATQWSLPKTELLRVIIPGLYGYRMDTEEGGNYWGAVGQFPGQIQTRHSGAGEYAGVLVVLAAIWAIAQALRKDASVFTPLERRWIWFWSITLVVSVLLAVGRHAPFYRIIYSLPYFSSIRNPMKFMHPGHVALVILFAYGLQGMVRRYFTAPAVAATAKTKAPIPTSSGWWAALPSFEKKWIVGSVAAVGVALLGWMIYASSRSELEKHLGQIGFGNPEMAKQIAGFSLTEVGWFVLFLLLNVGVLVLIAKGVFRGGRTKVGLIILGLLIVVDLARGNIPWVVAVDYKQKYASNPLVDLFKQRPYDNRVTASMPFGVPRELGAIQQYFHQMYVAEWMQHLFPYYNIQALDVTQLSRTPEDWVQFEKNTFQLNSEQRAAIQDRHWELTNTRYIVGLAIYEAGLNNIGPGKFRIHSRYELVPKPGITQPRTLEQLTVRPKEDGPIALFELTTALPRARLYTQWQLSTNTQETLQKLADESFDPHSTLLISEPLPGASTNEVERAVSGAPSTVETTSYKPKRRELKATVTAPSILLLNDKYDPDWKVRVDGEGEKLLRVNYLMRGVFLNPGSHTIVFSYEPPVRWLYITLVGMGIGVLLSIALLLASFRQRSDRP